MEKNVSGMLGICLLFWSFFMLDVFVGWARYRFLVCFRSLEEGKFEETQTSVETTGLAQSKPASNGSSPLNCPTLEVRIKDEFEIFSRFSSMWVPNTRNLPANFVIPWNQPGSDNQLTHCDAICVGIFVLPRVKRFVAEEMSLDLYVDPLAMVDEISALGLRHVGYGVPTELFQPLVLAYVEALKCTKCWKTSVFFAFGFKAFAGF